MKLITKLKEKREERKKLWELFIYYQGQLIEVRKVKETFEPTKEFYLVNIRNKRHLVGTNRRVTMLMHFGTYKATELDKRRLHIEVTGVKGVA